MLSPQTIMVTSPSDATGATGMTLRSAIALANADAPGDTITFAPNLQGPILLTQGELLITQSMQITGPGANLLTVERSTALGTRGFQIFDVNDSDNVVDKQVSITGLTITNGAYIGPGGGIHNSENLTLANDTINGNTGNAGVYNVGDLNSTGDTITGNAGSGIANNGGIVVSTNDVISNNVNTNGGVFNTGTGASVTLTNDTISGNTNNSGNGGGIYNYGTNDTMTLSGNLIENNSANSGGGIFNNTNSTLTSNNDTILSNSANDIGGIWNLGTASFTNDLISQNKTIATTFVGGGIYNGSSASTPATLTLTNDTISQNSAVAGGGGIFNDIGGILAGSNDTFSNNTATGTNTDGGAIYDNSSQITMIGSTFSGNSVSRYGGAIFVGGYDPTVTLTNDTLADNSAGYGGSIYNGVSGNASTTFVLVNDTISGNSSTVAGSGGGVQSNSSGAFTAINDIIVGNTAAGSTSNLVATGRFVTLIDNVSSGTLSQILATTPGNVNVPLLANNSGPTQTIALAYGPNNPAVGVASGLSALSANISNSGSLTTVNVTAAAEIQVGDKLRIDDEIVLVTASNSSTNSLTLQRGVDGTTPATHLMGAHLFLAYDQRGQHRNSNPDLGAFESQIPAVNVTLAGGTYNGSPYAVTNASVIGVNNTQIASFGSPALSYAYYAGTLSASQIANATPLSSPPVNCGAYTVVGTFTSNVNGYRNGISAPVDFSITPAILTSVTTTGSGIVNGNGDLNAGHTVSISLNFNGVVNLGASSGTPTLSLNDGGTAVCSSGSGTSSLVFLYTVGTNQNTPDLTVTAVNLNGATLQSGGPNVDLSAAVSNPAGILQVDTTRPYVESINRATPATASTNTTSVIYSAVFDEPVTGVDSSDFQVATTGTLAYSQLQVTLVSTSDYAVSVSGMTGHGTLGLNLVDNKTISDLAGNGLAGNLEFTPGQAVQYSEGTPSGTIEPPTLSPVTADLTNDGKQDLVTALPMSDAIAVFIGNGDGSFKTPTTFATVTNPESVAVADLNGDGKPDIVVFNGSSIGVTLGNGDGTFKPQQTFAVNQTFENGTIVGVADLNGDGKYDIVVQGFGGSENEAYALLGNGDGTFQAAKPVAVFNQNTGYGVVVSLTDVNGDGKPDLIVANNGSLIENNSSIEMLLGNGDGSFQSPQLIESFPHTNESSWSGVSVGDINGDGKTDLVFFSDGGRNSAGQQISDVELILGKGDGTFQTPRIVGTVPFTDVAGSYLTIADLNGDGSPDVIASYVGNTQTFLLLGNGDGTFRQPQILQEPISGGLIAPLFADINGDGLPDVLSVYNHFPNPGAPLSAEVDPLINTTNGDFIGQTYSVTSVPIVTNPTEANIVANSAFLGGDVTDDGGTPVNFRGVIYAPTSANPDLTLNGAGIDILGARGTTGTFTANVTGLAPNTSYSFVAFATNANGTTYSSPVSTFTTPPTPATVMANDNGGSYNGTPYPATATVTGSGNATVSGNTSFLYYVGSSVNGTGSSTAPTTAGTYTVVASFVSSDSNYSNASSSPLQFQIVAATPTVSVADAGGDYSGNSFPASVMVTGINGTTVSGSTTVTYYAGTDVSASGSTTAPTAAGTYTVVAAFTSLDPNYTGASNTPMTFTINAIAPIVVATDASGPYSANPYTASAMATGINGTVAGNTVFTYYPGGNTLSSGVTTAPAAAGAYTVVAAFTSLDPNYTNALSAPITFTINPIVPTIVAADAGGTFTGNPYSASASVTGLTGTVAGSSTFTYYSGSSVGSSGSTTAPTNAGTYTVEASFSSSDPNYTNASSVPVTFVINPAVQAATTTTVTAASVALTYGQTDVFTATVTSPAGTPNGGTVDFFDASTSTLLGTVNLVNGTATLSPITLGIGVHVVTATYNGTPSFAPSHSSVGQTSVIQTVPNSQNSQAYGVAVDASGNVFIADTFTSRILKVDASTGVVSTYAGNGSFAYSGDGGAATAAALSLPQGITLDAAGDLFIADWGNNAIREVNASTGIITTVAGNGTFGYSGDGALATQASMEVPYSVAVDASGNLYIADSGNNVIREVSASTGLISTFAGNGTIAFGGDGGLATAASLYNPQAVAVDATGDLFISDTGHYVIREVNASTGVISTVAGNGSFGYSGDGSLATNASLRGSEGIAVDAAGDLFITDGGNSVIRMVTASTGLITTLAGNGTFGYSGDGGNPTSAALNFPQSLALNSAGDLFISDAGNHVIREVFNATSVQGSVTVTVTAATTTTVSVSSPALSYGQSETMSANVQSLGGVPNSGTVTFFNGTTSLGTANVNGGIATLTTTSLLAGPYSITATYSGTAGFAANTSTSSASVNVTPAAPLVTITDPGHSYSGVPIPPPTVSITGVFGETVNGTTILTYYPGNMTTGSGSTTAPTSAGTYTAIASFTSYDPDYSNASSVPLIVQVFAATPTVSVTDVGGVYNGNQFPANASVTGINGVTVGGSTTFTYYAGSAVSGTGSTGAPVALGTYTVVATFTSNDSNYSNATSSSVSFNITTASSKLVFSPSLPATLTAGGSTGPITVLIEDKNGNLVTGDNSTTLTLKVNGVIVATKSDSNGVVTFNSQKLTKSGNNTIAITSSPALTAASATIVVSSNVPTHLVFTAQPATSIVAGNTLGAVKVAVEDAYNNVVTTDTNQPSLTVNSLTGGPPAGINALASIPTISTSNGVTTFSNLVLDYTGTYTLSVSDSADLTSAQFTSTSFKVTPAPATTMSVLRGLPSSDGTAGVALSPPVQIAFYDRLGNLATNDTSTVTLTVTSGGNFSTGLSSVSAKPVGGIATFSNLIFNQSGVHSLSASDPEGSLVGGTVTVGSINIDPAVASKLVFAQPLPQTLTAGGTTGPITVQVEDRFGNLVTGDLTRTLTLKVNGAVVTTTTGANGVATFDSQKLTKSGNNTIAITSSPALTAASATIVVSSNVPTHLVFTAQPATSIVAGNTLGAVKVAVEDAYNNVVTTDTNQPSLTVNSLTGGPPAGINALASIPTISTSNGVTTFNNLVLDYTGKYSIIASDTVDAGVASSTSPVTPTVTPGTATSMVLLQPLQSINAIAGVGVTQIQVAILDQFGNLKTNDPSSVVTLTAGNGGYFSIGTQSTSEYTRNGIAAFYVAFNQSGTYSLTATDSESSLTNGSLYLGTLQVNPAAASRLVMSSLPSLLVHGEPTGGIAVYVEDAYGNLVNSQSVVTLQINGTTIATATASKGVALFNGQILTKIGINVVSAISGSLLKASATIVVS